VENFSFRRDYWVGERAGGIGKTTGERKKKNNSSKKTAEVSVLRGRGSQRKRPGRDKLLVDSGWSFEKKKNQKLSFPIGD